MCVKSFLRDFYFSTLNNGSTGLLATIEGCFSASKMVTNRSMMHDFFHMCEFLMYVCVVISRVLSVHCALFVFSY
jgi:hypothetical protein